MKIVKLQAENIKRLTAVSITPDGALVEITGKNGQGKTSVLDAIWWALGGGNAVQSKPIRKGATEAMIRLDLGEFTVTRTFKFKEIKNEDGTKTVTDELTTQLKVENKEGFRPSSPQKMLDGMLGQLSFDPLEFARMDAKEQFDALRRFVPGVNFEDLKVAEEKDMALRRDKQRDYDREHAAGTAIKVPDDAPEAPVDDTDLMAKLTSAGEHNAAIETEKGRREHARQEIARMHAQARTQQDNERKRIEESREHIKRIEQVIALAEQNIADLEARVQEMDEALAAEPLPLKDPIDTEKLAADITEQRRLMDGYRLRKRKEDHIAAALRLKDEVDAITAAIEARRKAKREAIAAAKMPVEGLGFGDSVVTMDGIPFDQASDAERLRVSVALAMAGNPKLRVIRIRDGSLLDSDSLGLIAKMAEEKDMQVWLESVDSKRPGAIVMEDGHVKGAEDPQLPLAEKTDAQA